MSTVISVLQKLTDGHFHSGVELGRSLNISRAAVWKAIKKLQNEWQLNIHSIPGKGYRLAEPLQLLDKTEILSAMHKETRSTLGDLEVLWSTDSTNRIALQRADSGRTKSVAVLAEHQSAGRGRRGRHWESPFSRNLYLSLVWQFETDASSVSGLSLAVALAVVRTLQKIGADDLHLKWPNDVLWMNRKLCGVLLEMHGESTGPWKVVIGIGLNVNMGEQASVDIDQPWVDLHTVLGHRSDRNQLAGMLLSELIEVIEQFQLSGLEPFISEWQKYDATCNKQVELHFPNTVLHGISRGINSQGALLLEVDGEIRPYHAGEVSLRNTQHA